MYCAGSAKNFPSVNLTANEIVERDVFWRPFFDKLSLRRILLL